MMTTLFRAIVISLALLCWAPSSYSADWYVDIANDGGTENGLAWATAWGKFSDISWASVGAGDTIWVRGGTYSDSISVPTGEQVNIKIDPEATTQAVFTSAHFYNNDSSSIDGYISDTYKYMFKFTEITGGLTSSVNIRLCNVFTAKGLEISREDDNYTSDTTQQHGIRVWNESGPVTIDTCYIHHTSGDGINISQPVYTGMVGNDYSWFTIKNTYIINVGDDAVQVPSYVTLNDNILDQNGHTWMLGAHPDGIQVKSGALFGTSGYYKIYNNIFRGWGQNIFWEYITDSAYAYNNVIIGGVTITKLERAFNISVCSEGYRSCSKAFEGDFIIANNTIYNMLDYHAINGGAASDAKIKNNIFVNCKRIGSSGTLESLIGPSNVWYDEADVQFYTSGGDPTDPPAERYNDNATNADPKLNSYDMTTGFRPTVDSTSLLNAGVVLSYFTTDILGTDRGASWDIGAYEYASSPDPPASPHKGRITAGAFSGTMR